MKSLTDDLTMQIAQQKRFLHDAKERIAELEGKLERSDQRCAELEEDYSLALSDFLEVEEELRTLREGSDEICIELTNTVDVSKRIVLNTKTGERG